MWFASTTGDIVASFLFKADVNVFDHGWVDNKTLILRSADGRSLLAGVPEHRALSPVRHRETNRADQLFVRQQLGVGREDGELRGRFRRLPPFACATTCTRTRSTPGRSSSRKRAPRSTATTCSGSRTRCWNGSAAMSSTSSPTTTGMC